PRTTNVIVASRATPVCTAAVQDTRFRRRTGGPAGRPASAGQMISSTLPAASVASTTPLSAGGTASGPNASGPARPVTEPPLPVSVTSPVPEMNAAEGTALVAQAPRALIQPAGIDRKSVV